MNFLIATLLLVLAWLSSRSMQYTRARSPWTFWAWAATIAYCVYAYIEIRPLFGLHLPEHGEYVFLIALTVAFVVAGVKDEAQAEPWYLPTRLGPTRAEKAARR